MARPSYRQPVKRIGRQEKYRNRLPADKALPQLPAGLTSCHTQI
jgi:hypothetical protein